MHDIHNQQQKQGQRQQHRNCQGHLGENREKMTSLEKPYMARRHVEDLISWNQMQFKIFRTLISWSIKPRWRSKAGHRSAMWRGVTDFLRQRWGKMPDA